MAELKKVQSHQEDADFDRTYKPEVLSDEDLMKAYVALTKFSAITQSKWLKRIETEMRRRGLGLPH